MKWLDWLPPGLLLAGVAFVLDAGSGEAAIGLLLALCAVISSFKNSLRYRLLRDKGDSMIVVTNARHMVGAGYALRGEELDKAIDDEALAALDGGAP